MHGRKMSVIFAQGRGELIGGLLSLFRFSGVDDRDEQVLELGKLGLECCRALSPWQVCREEAVRLRTKAEMAGCIAKSDDGKCSAG